MLESDCDGSHAGPSQVPNIDKQTLPFLYKFGLNRTVPFDVVIKRTRGGLNG